VNFDPLSLTCFRQVLAQQAIINHGDIMAVISMRQFLEAGVHFGHQTKRWNPNMAPYIYGVKSGIHVIDLRQSLKQLKVAYEYAKTTASEGRNFLFVGTKPQIQNIIQEEADRCGANYINFRWLGGMLTNFSTVKQSISRLKEFEELAGKDDTYEGIIKKEALRIQRKRGLPDLIFVVDCRREHLAIREANKLGIPIIAIADTNSDPKDVTVPIPGNDDSPKAVRLFASVIATGILEGRTSRASISTADSGTPAEISQAAPAPAESEPEMKSDSADNEVTDTPATPE
jgi:small subunit ribosomal protein S2